MQGKVCGSDSRKSWFKKGTAIKKKIENTNVTKKEGQCKAGIAF